MKSEKKNQLNIFSKANIHIHKHGCIVIGLYS